MSGNPYRQVTTPAGGTRRIFGPPPRVLVHPVRPVTSKAMKLTGTPRLNQTQIDQAQAKAKVTINAALNSARKKYVAQAAAYRAQAYRNLAARAKGVYGKSSVAKKGATPGKAPSLAGYVPAPHHPPITADGSISTAARAAYERMYAADEARRRAAYLAQQVDQHVDPVATAKLKKFGEIVTVSDAARSAALKVAVQTGDYTAILRKVAADQALSGGRYVDQQSYDAAMNAQQQVVAQAQKFVGLAQQLDGMVKTNKLDKARALFASKAYQDSFALYKRTFGDGKVPGTAQESAALLASIARTNDDYMARVALGYQPPVDSAEYKRQSFGVQTAQRPLVAKNSWGQIHVSVTDLLQQTHDAEVRRMTEAYALKMQQEADAHARRDLQFGSRIQDSFTAGVQAAWAKSGLSADQIKALLDQNDHGGNAARDAAYVQLLDAAVSEWDRVNKPGYLGNLVYESNVSLADHKKFAAYRAARQQYRDQVSMLLTGHGYDSGRDLMNMPGLGQALHALSWGQGAVGSLVRAAGGGLGGEFVTPDIHINPFEWWDSQGQFKGPIQGSETGLGGLLGFGLDTSSAAKARAEQSAQDMLKGIGQNAGDLGAQLDTIAGYGGQFTRGNLGQVLGGAFIDPTIALAPLRFLQGGKVAIARLGGLRAALGSPSEFLADFYRLVAPAGKWGGAKFALKDAQLGLRYGKEFAGRFPTLSTLTEADAMKLVDDLAAASGDLTLQRSILDRTLHAPAVERSQILAAVDAVAARRLAERGINVIDPAQYEKNLLIAERATAQAARDASAAAALTRRVVDRQTGAQVVESKFRGVTPEQGKAIQAAYDAGNAELGQKLQREATAGVGAVPGFGVPPQLVQPQLVARDRGVAVLKQVIDRQTALAGELRASAAVLRDVNATGLARQEALHKLDQSLQDFQGFASRDVQMGGSVSHIPGRVERARAVLESIDARTVNRMSYSKLTAVRIESDMGIMDALIATARTAVRDATSPVERAAAVARLRELGSGRRYLAYEKRVDSGAATTADDTVRAYGRQAKAAINPSRVAAFATSRGGVLENLAGELHGRLRNAPVGPVVEPLDAALVRRARGLVEELGTAKVDWSDPRLSPFVQALSGLDAASVIEALDSLRGRFPKSSIASAMNALIEQSLGRFKTHGLVMKDVLSYLHEGHLGGVLPTLKDYTRANSRVTEALRNARQRIAQGQVRLAKPRAADAAVGFAVRSDSDLGEVAVKARALRSVGMTVRQYDELRGVLGQPTGRAMTSQSLRREAAKLVRAEGITPQEAFLRVRDVRVGQEANIQLQWFAHDALPGASPEEIFRAFEQMYIERDLVPFDPQAITGYQHSVLENVFKGLTGVSDLNNLDSVKAGLTRHTMPPLGDRGEMIKWLQDTGAWSPRTAETVRAGGRVWSITEERAFYEGRFGWTPPWTDPSVLAPLLRDKRLYDAQMRAWGFFTRGAEVDASSLEALAMRTRTISELRRWAAERFGSVVSDDGGVTMKEMPWLMNPTKPEYLDFAGRAASDSLDPRMVSVSQIASFGKAVERVVDNHVQRMVEAAKGDAGLDFLPMERVKLDYEMASELLLTQEWRSFIERRPLVGRTIGAFGYLQRLFAAAGNPAFIPMNLLDSFAGKPLILALVHGDVGAIWGGVRTKFADLIPNLEAIDIHSRGMFDIHEKTGFQIFRDPSLSPLARETGFKKMVLEFPFAASSKAEDPRKLHFAQRIAQETYDSAIRLGAVEETAIAVAKKEARRVVLDWWPTGESRRIPFLSTEVEGLLNELSPFFSYNYRNKILGIRNILMKPYLISQAMRLGDLIFASNLEAWSADNPGVPMPAAFGSKLIVTINGTKYTVDLSQMSDWFRGPAVFTGQNPPKSLAALLNVFIRPLAPVQAAFLADVFGFNGGITPWGTEADLASWFPVADLLQSWANMQAFDPNNPKSIDMVQFITKQLFFQSFGRIEPYVVSREVYFHLQEIGDFAGAKAYLAEHPELASYFASLPVKGVSPLDPTRTWFQTAGDLKISEYEKAQAGLDAVLAGYDRRLDNLMPWDPSYSGLKAQRRLAYALYQQQHPILGEVQMAYMTPQRWAEQLNTWQTDALTDAYFARQATRPVRTSYKTELAYLQALKAFDLGTTALLRARPMIAIRLAASRSAIEFAWKAHQDQLGELLAHETDIKIRLLQEEAKGSAADQHLISILYGLKAADQAQIYGESFADLYAGTDIKKRGLRGFFSPSLVRPIGMPGLSSKSGGAAPAWSASFGGSTELHDRYVQGISAVFNAAHSGAEFYDLLSKDPWLFQKYMDLHPDKKAKFAAGNEYFSAMKRWVSFLQAGDHAKASAYFDSLPAWIKDRYYAKHPKSASGYSGAAGVATSAYMGAMSHWIGLLNAKNAQGANDYFRSLPSWMKEKYYLKHPEQRARNDLTSTVLAAAADYFLAADADKAGVIARNPELMVWLREHGGQEAARRGLITAIYSAIPSSDAWLKRTFRERYPDVFGSPLTDMAAKIAKVAKTLTEHPEIRDAFIEMYAREQAAYAENLHHQKQPPAPYSIDRLKALKARRRVRANSISRHFKMNPLS